MRLIYCAAGNKRFAEIAMRYGFEYGAQLPSTVYYPPVFVDQDFKDPERERYMEALAKHRPALATVLDLEHPHQLPEVIAWSLRAAEYVSEAVIIIPKYDGVIARLPHTIGGKQVRLGYSVESSYGKTTVPLHEFEGWPIHLLGGSPHRQMRLARTSLDVRSADGNYWMLMANKCQFFANGAALYARNRFWPQLAETKLGYVDTDANYAAFELSCINIQAAWKGFKGYIRFASEDDLPAVKKIANQYKNELGHVMWPSLRRAVQLRQLYVAEFANYIAGFVNFNRVQRGPNKGKVTVYEIAANRDWVGQGVGRALLNAIPGIVRLKVTKDNQNAIAFYERVGFQCVGEERGRSRELWVMERNHDRLQ